MKELFGQRLREQRQNQGLTMEQLAEKANLSTNFIGAIERGLKEPSLSTLISILNALDIPADVLLRDYVGTASHVTDEEICKRLEGLTPIQKRQHSTCWTPISPISRILQTKNNLQPLQAYRLGFSRYAFHLHRFRL